MKDIIANNIRTLRKARGWSQPELVRRTGVDQRTVQRAESSGPISADTLGLIAQALGVVPEVLRSDLEALSRRHRELQNQFLERHTILRLLPITRAPDLLPIMGCDALSYERAALETDAQEAASAALHGDLLALLEGWNDLDPDAQCDALRGLQPAIARAHREGLQIAAARRPRQVLVIDGARMPLVTSIVVVSTAKDPKMLVAWEKGPRPARLL